MRKNKELDRPASQGTFHSKCRQKHGQAGNRIGIAGLILLFVVVTLLQCNLWLTKLGKIGNLMKCKDFFLTIRTRRKVF